MFPVTATTTVAVDVTVAVCVAVGVPGAGAFAGAAGLFDAHPVCKFTTIKINKPMRITDNHFFSILPSLLFATITIILVVL
jgi:hypothetical protein